MNRIVYRMLLISIPAGVMLVGAIAATVQGRLTITVNHSDGPLPGSILPPGRWTNLLNEEFAGTSIDTNKWFIPPDGVIVNGQDYNKCSTQLAINNGTAAFFGFNAVGQPGNLNNAIGGCQIQTSSDLAHGGQYGPGYFEAKLLGDTSNHGWGAFWAIGPNSDCGGGIAKGFEADIIEFIGGGSGHNGIHWDGYGSCHNLVTSPVKLNTTDGFHVWGMLYDTNNGLSFYRDGVQTFSYNQTGGVGATKLVIIVGNFLHQNSGTSNGMIVNWVRWYRRS